VSDFHHLARVAVGTGGSVGISRVAAANTSNAVKPLYKRGAPGSTGTLFTEMLRRRSGPAATRLSLARVGTYESLNIDLVRLRVPSYSRFKPSGSRGMPGILGNSQKVPLSLPGRWREPSFRYRRYAK
jgi:hypothetical protein